MIIILYIFNTIMLHYALWQTYCPTDHADRIARDNITGISRPGKPVLSQALQFPKPVFHYARGHYEYEMAHIDENEHEVTLM